MNTNLIEAQNLNEVSALFLKKKFMIYRPEADIDGIDFIIQTPENSFLKCRLKSRAYVQWNKYGNKNIYMVFPGKGNSFQREWYLVPHDILFEKLKEIHGNAPKWNHPDFGEYWHEPVSTKLAEELKSFSIQSPTNKVGHKLLQNHELKSHMFEIEAKKDWEKLHEIGYSIIGYDELPYDSGLELMSALYEKCFSENEFPVSLFNLRLLLYWQLRLFYWHSPDNFDYDYERCNLILEKIRHKLNHG